MLIYLTKHCTKLERETTLVSDQIGQIFDLTFWHGEEMVRLLLFWGFSSYFSFTIEH